MDSPVASELRDILTHYDLGELLDYEKNERGFVNTAYAIWTQSASQRKRYFLRKYKRGAAEEELRFEHSLIEHLVEAGAPVAPIHATRSGSSYLRRREGNDDAVGVFYTIFDYLPGEDRFTWIDPVMTPGELRSSAEVLAELHINVSGFTPQGRRVEPKIIDLLPVIADTWACSPAKTKGTVFDDRIRERLEPVSANIAATLAALREPAARSLPEIMIHCDYHPGNLKFQGETVSGVFDFDWSKLDARLFDLGLALWYFCTSWQGPEDGTFRLDWARTFLSAYQDTLAAHPGAPAMTTAEAHYLPIMINAGNLYVLHWTVLDYFAKDVDPVDYLVFLDHSLNSIQWYEQPRNYKALEEMIASIFPPLTG